MEHRSPTPPTHGLVNHAGEVFGNPGLFVADAAAFPSAPGFPPSMTIAALAERQAELIVENAQTVTDATALSAAAGSRRQSEGPDEAST